MKTSGLAWLFILICSSSLMASKPRSERPISLEIHNLTRWRNSAEADAIQQSLRAILHPRKNHPRAPTILADFDLYQPLFKEPFLLLEAENNPFGGFFALVVFKGDTKVLRLWVFEISTNVFELREIEPFRGISDKRILDDLADKRIGSFWISMPSK